MLVDGVTNFDDQYVHVKPIVDCLPVDLSDEERRRAIDVITRNADVFSRHEFDLGCTDLLQYRIDTGDHRPIAEPLRSHARAHLDIIDDAQEKLLKAGVIEPGSGPWSFNVVVGG